MACCYQCHLETNFHVISRRNNYPSSIAKENIVCMQSYRNCKLKIIAEITNVGEVSSQPKKKSELSASRKVLYK
jgi:hypothetical protein